MHFLNGEKTYTREVKYCTNLLQTFVKTKKNLQEPQRGKMGKPIKESRSEVEKSAWVMDFYGYNGGIFINPESVNTDASKSAIKFEPHGVIGSIMPFNFPRRLPRMEIKTWREGDSG